MQRTLVLLGLLAISLGAASAPPLGLPPLPDAVREQITPERVQLGKRLFHDSRFSSTGEVACHSCHLDAIAFHDGRMVPRGVHKQQGTRNAPTVLNAAYAGSLFWDGRASSLEEQSLQPLTNPVEHGLTDLDEALATIKGDAGYVAMFHVAYGVVPEEISMALFASAIAAYERTLVFGNSPFDRWHFGDEEQAVDDSVKRGYALFVGAAGCSRCHTVEADYALFSDDAFHNVNVGFQRLQPAHIDAARSVRPASLTALDHAVLTDIQRSELGRFAVSGYEDDIGAFRTPGLRNVARTAPYMHDGSLLTLAQVVHFFNNGGKSNLEEASNPWLSPLIQPLHLSSDEEADIVAFLQSLTSPEFQGWYR